MSRSVYWGRFFSTATCDDNSLICRTIGTFTTLADEAPFLGQFPDELQKIIAAAGDFWQLMDGAHIRYNCLLQAKHGTSALQDEFEAEWDDGRLNCSLFRGSDGIPGFFGT